MDTLVSRGDSIAVIGVSKSYQYISHGSQSMSEIMTVREAVRRAKEDGLPISEYALRNWIKNGKIPIRNAGNKQLLYYPNLIRFLQCENGSDNNVLM